MYSDISNKYHKFYLKNLHLIIEHLCIILKLILKFTVCDLDPVIANSLSGYLIL